MSLLAVLRWRMGSERDEEGLLLRIIVIGLALSFGVMLASLEMLRPNSNGYSLQLSWGTLPAFIVGMVVSYPCFRVIVYSRQKKPRRLAMALVAFAGIASFLYPLRFVPKQTLPSLLVGLGCAVLALSVVGGFLLLARRFFERETPSSQE